MSQRGVEVVLGRLVTDAALRQRFETDPWKVLEDLMTEGIELSQIERSSLASLDRTAVDGFAETLDPRIKKVRVASTPSVPIERNRRRHR